MADSAQRSFEEPSPATPPFSYVSIVLKQLVDTLEPLPAGQLLDIGPVYGDNIGFFSRRVSRLYIFDQFRSLDKDRRTGFPPGRYWRHLDYPSEYFDGILLWDLVDRLNDPEAYSLVKRCLSMAKPGGMILLFTFGKQASPTGNDGCIVGNDGTLYLHPFAFSNLPVRYRQNRDILGLFSAFVPLKSLIYRNGIREFLFQRG